MARLLLMFNSIAQKQSEYWTQQLISQTRLLLTQLQTRPTKKGLLQNMGKAIETLAHLVIVIPTVSM